MARSHHTLPRRALTLLEVLLVLALLVVLASVVWPALEPVLAGLELRKSGERIRVEWNRARVDALSSGRTILFRYVPDTNRYSIEQRREPQFAPGSGSSQTAVAQPESEAPSREAVLPERIKFVRSEISNNEVDASGSTATSTLEGDWSDPVVFYPDGTTSDVTLVLKNEREQCVELSLRGLTAVVTIGDVYAGEEGGP